jgi:hypothetical protein
MMFGNIVIPHKSTKYKPTEQEIKMDPQEDLQTLGLIVTFLNRLDLKGQEVPSFNRCLNYLQLQAQVLQTPPAPPEEVTADIPRKTK